MTTLRVATYNIHKGIGGVDRRYRPARVAEVLAALDADVICLQEVDAGAARSAHHRQVDWLGDALGLPHRAWAENVTLRSGGGYGNAILARHPLLAAQNVDLTIGRRKRRSALLAELRLHVDGQPRVVHVASIHLGLAERERHAQIARLLAWPVIATPWPPTPVIVAGDLNDVYGSLAAALAPGRLVSAPTPRTFPAWAPLRALDGIYVRDARLLEVVRAEGALAKRASDHRALVATVELP